MALQKSYIRSYKVASESVSAHKPCGVPSGDETEKQSVMAEFTSFQDTIMLHKRGRFGLEKVQNSEIYVKVLDMEYGNI